MPFFPILKNKVLETISDVVTALRPPRWHSKVFCIGFNKTGTTSFVRAMKMLGYRNLSYSRQAKRWYIARWIHKLLWIASKYDSFDDIPWLKADLIPVLDYVFPNSKFIFLDRDEESWRNSMSRWKYKMTGKQDDKDKYFKGFLEHREFVRTYFAGREGVDLITLDISDPLGFEKLATFLGKKAPQQHFPHFNKTALIK